MQGRSFTTIPLVLIVFPTPRAPPLPPPPPPPVPLLGHTAQSNSQTPRTYIHIHHPQMIVIHNSYVLCDVKQSLENNNRGKISSRSRDFCGHKLQRPKPHTRQDFEKTCQDLAKILSKFLAAEILVKISKSERLISC